MLKPVEQLGQRPQEHGRIKFGVKTRNAMKTIDTFRFTSVDREALEQIAVLYDGTVRTWSDPKANPPDQYELISRAHEIRVFVIPGGLTVWYEQWAGGGIRRRCDGVTCQVTTAGPEGGEPTEVPCICHARQREDCKPKARLSVILPEINFGGVWRLETGSKIASDELTAMETLLTQLQSHGLVEAVLCLERQSRIRNGKKHNFIIPRLRLINSVDSILAGDVSVVPVLPAATGPQAALPAPPPTPSEPGGGLHFDLDAVIDVDESAAGGAAPADTAPSGRAQTGAIPHDGQAAVPPQETPDLSEGAAPSSDKGLDRLSTRLVLTCKDAALRSGMDEDFLRHALARKASEGATASSMRLTRQQKGQVIDWATEIADGDWLCIVGGEDPPYVILERP